MNYDNMQEKLRDIHRAKNTDYGNSATDTFNKYGDTSYLTRLSDKLSRLDSLIVNAVHVCEVKDETILDTIMDLANYAIMYAVDYTNKMEETNNGH